MPTIDLAHRRLHNQHITAGSAAQPSEVVAWLGAVQAQDYAGAKWALGLRAPGLTDAAIDRAFAEGAMLRTHVMRPTWHFVTPADIRWLLALTAPRVQALSAYWYRRLEIDAATAARAAVALARALQGGNHLTRTELVPVFEQAGITTDTGLRTAYLIGHAEQEGLVCSGGRRGKQFTYALLDERAPPTRVWARDEALAELARRYFIGHGPATVADFVWWSGLTTADARAGLTLVASQLAQETVAGQTYWFAPQGPAAPDPSPTVYLLPNYDEYVVGYTDRRAIFAAAGVNKLDPRGNILFSHTVVVDGQVAGTWKRTLQKSGVRLEATLLAPLDDAAKASFAAGAARYAAFLEMPVAALAHAP